MKRFDIDGALVRDQNTGLFWPQDAGTYEFPLSWAEASAVANQLSRTRWLDHSDWRLPSRAELFSLISQARINPALPQDHPFVNVFDGYYWTSDTCARLPDQAWYVHLGGGRVQKGMKHGSYMFWPVAGPPWGLPEGPERFQILENGTLLDRQTRLAWAPKAFRSSEALNWQAALHFVESLNDQKALGFQDWRLPEIRELESLVDLNTHSPALFAADRFTGVPEGYWSATTSVYETRYAWVLYTRDGAVGVGFKPKPEFFVWPVKTIVS